MEMETMRDLYAAARSHGRLVRGYGHLISFSGIRDLTAYNATPPLWLRVGGEMRRVVAARVEAFDDLAHSRVMFFEMKSATLYELIEDAPVFYGEDPSIVTINGEIVLLTVNVVAKRNNDYAIKTEIRRAGDVLELWKPWRSMPGKDNRLIPVDNGERLVVLTRPEGVVGGLGKMAMLEIESLDALTHKRLREAKIITMPIGDGEWVGPNEGHDIAVSNQVGILGHVALSDGVGKTGSKTYFSVFWWVDRETGKVVDTIPLALRKDFPMLTETDAKLSELRNVFYPTGLTFQDLVLLHGGLEDVAQGYVPINNPKITNLYAT